MNPPIYAGHHPLSDEAKDDIFDFTNKIFHEAAAVWQYVSQGDPQESEDMLRCIEIHVGIIRAQIAEFQTDETRLKAAAKAMKGTHRTVSVQILHPEGTAPERDNALTGEQQANLATALCAYTKALKAAYPSDTRITTTHHHARSFV